MKTIIVLSVAALGFAATCLAATPDPQELGKSLTPFGAIKAANADGSIPAYDGGYTRIPAGFKADSGFWVDPFKDEKPLFRIDAKNVDQYADKLSDGQKMMLKKFPDYYFDIYPSHRTTAYPKDVLDATLRNGAANCLLKNGLAVDPACRGGLPFPLPPNGNQVMWNQQLRFRVGHGYSTTSSSDSWVIDANGEVTKTAEQATFEEAPWYQTAQADRDPMMYSRVFSVNGYPARRAGEMVGLNDYLDPEAKPRRSWSYSPGQRRVKQAPEFNYDTPVASQGGVTLFDELQMFSGAQDRFDYKLVGRKEMYIPYNEYKLYFDAKQSDQFMTHHVNPALERWELHRVWVVEATLKPGMRHVYSKRTYYLDEDTFGAGLYDAWDSSGALYRSIFLGGIQMYDKNIPYNVKNVVYDFNKGMWALLNDGLKGGYKIFDTPRPEREMNAEAIVAKETQR